MTDFWSEALGYAPQSPPDGFETWEAFADTVGIPQERRNDFGAVVDPDGVGPRIFFERYDAGPVSRRLHFDVNSVGGRGVDLTDEQRRAALHDERERLESIGATFERVATGAAGEIWIEMLDPEGNWFCVQ